MPDDPKRKRAPSKAARERVRREVLNDPKLKDEVRDFKRFVDAERRAKD